MTAKELESKAWRLIGMAKVADGCTAMRCRLRMPTSWLASHGAFSPMGASSRRARLLRRPPSLLERPIVLWMSAYMRM